MTITLFWTLLFSSGLIGCGFFLGKTYWIGHTITNLHTGGFIEITRTRFTYSKKFTEAASNATDDYDSNNKNDRKDST